VPKHQQSAEPLSKISARRKPAVAEGEAEGQASYEMAILRPERTGLPFVVFISQKGGARDDVRVKVAPGAKVRRSEMVTVAIRPNVRVARGRLAPHDLALLERWISLNFDTLIRYWDGDFEYAEDAIEAIVPVDAS
jgi:hypothetical protein